MAAVLREANELTGLFIEYGPTVQIRGTGSRVWRDGNAGGDLNHDGPVAIMIDRLSVLLRDLCWAFRLVGLLLLETEVLRTVQTLRSA